ncbi:hypothetical protein [Campylobacter sp. RM16192]|uniref:hypothetical protein n=1 Tax=Campylobacter sp. RM16192 TaxID=1660080 RepID=UPI00145187C2|nr:hypothetical protein [Campylobacter sp. RM16192]QCD52814.1 hypothetical protein CDOMC_1207 [Campylobacter sp. RM16192]
MARITDEAKEKILADFHTGKFSQRELAKKYNISNGSVANLLKGLTPENEHLVEAQISLLSAQNEKSEVEMSSILSAAKDEAFNRGLIFNATHKLIKRATEMIDKNTKMDKVNIGDGTQIFEPVELNPLDLKNLQEAIHKGGETLGVVTKAPTTQITNTNAQQSTKIVIERKELKSE